MTLSVEYHAHSSRRLLPGTVEEVLKHWTQRSAGLVLATIIVGASAALITWSPSDPSLSSNSAREARNLLGAPGTLVADVLLQTLGLAVGFFLIALLAIAAELASRGKVFELRKRLAFIVLATVTIAGGASALRPVEGWPFESLGFGGILGDVAYGSVSALIVPLFGAEAGTVGGLVFFATGFWALSTALCLERSGLLHVNFHGRIGPAVPPSRSSKRAGAQSTDAGAHPQSTVASSIMVASGDERGAPKAILPDREAADDDVDLPKMLRRERPKIRDNAGDVRLLPASDEPSARQPAERAPQPGPVEPLRRRVMQLLSWHYGLRLAEEPSLNRRAQPKSSRSSAEKSAEVQQDQKQMLEDVLAEFRIRGTIREVSRGPVITLFELEPALGIKSSRVIILADDIARALGMVSVRISLIPGRDAIGIELPNTRRETFRLNELIASDAFRDSTAKLPLALGKAIGGEPILIDLARMPHLLVAGSRGSGRSVGINAMILSLICRLRPEQCRFLLIGPKTQKLSTYDGIPHLLGPVVTDPQKAVTALGRAVGEMQERKKRMADLGVRSIDAFNNRVLDTKRRGEKLTRTVQTGFDPRTGEAVFEQRQLEAEPLPYVVIVVDELADLLAVAGKEIEGLVQRLAQEARAVGIHMIMATQRPSADVITGIVKANFPARISYRVTSRLDSRAILGEQGAEQLLGGGDMLFRAGRGNVERVHGASVSDEDVRQVTSELRQAYSDPQFEAC